jgi:hypothetical protein
MISFRLRLTGHGWLECLVSDGRGSALARASYLSDAVGHLLSALENLMAGNDAACDFADEPGCHRWQFQRTGDRLRIDLHFNDERSDSWESRFACECGLLEFAQAIDRELDRNLAELGPDAYRQLWGYRYPQQAHHHLKEAIGQLSRDL